MEFLSNKISKIWQTSMPTNVFKKHDFANSNQNVFFFKSLKKMEKEIDNDLTKVTTTN